MCEFCGYIKDITLVFYVCEKCEKDFYQKNRGVKKMNKQKELNAILMDSFAIAEKWFDNGYFYRDTTLKQRRSLENLNGVEFYSKLLTMNLGKTSITKAAARIMLLNLSGKTFKVEK